MASENLQRRRRAAGVEEIADKLEQRGRALTRRNTGASFENELATVHRVYEFLKVGRLRRQHVPFKKIKNTWQPVGSAGVDYAGHVCAEWLASRELRGISIARLRDVEIRDRWARVYPVAFDAKVIGAEHATYTHEKPKQHQLHDLKAEAAAGAYAFLLVYARPPRDRVYILSIEEHLAALLGKGVRLWDSLGDCQHSIGRATTGPASGMLDWIPLLQWCAGGYD